MNEIDESLDLSKKNIPFNIYFEERNGFSIDINLNENKCYILGADGSVNGSVRLGRSAINAGLDLSSLLNKNKGKGQYMYFVLIDGYEHSDWLFALELVF